MADEDFERGSSRFTDRITADGSSPWPVEPGRYRLVVSLACPWASRAVVVRRLLGLEDALPMAVTDPVQDERSWRFTLDPGGRDPVLGIRFLHEAYDRRAAADGDPDYPGGVSVPAVVDTRTGRLVTNDYQRLTLDLETQWRALHRPGAPDLYPEHLREEIGRVSQRIFTDLNNGVYRAGFAKRQRVYERAHDAVFACLDALSDHLATRRYVVADSIT